MNERDGMPIGTLYFKELYNALNLQVPYFLLDLAEIQTYRNAKKKKNDVCACV
jgi:hypothetical protein